MKFTLKKNATLLDAVLEMYKGVSKQKAKQIIKHSFFKINSKPIKTFSGLTLKMGDIVEISTENKKTDAQKQTSQKHKFIYFDDDYLVVAKKSAGVLSCNSLTEKNPRNFKKQVEDYLNRNSKNKIRLWVVHRLDREVEGLIIFAKSEKIQKKLKDNWQQITKKYLALLENIPPKKTDTVESWLRDNHQQKVEVFNKEIPGSKYAKTGYTFLRNVGNYALVEVLLYTGRKNQIRVHMSQLGCPIAGDRKYGANADFKRQIRLAAFYLKFNSPITNETIELSYKPSKFFFKPSSNKDENYKMFK